MRKKVASIAKLLAMFECWVVQHVQREFNGVADWVANQYVDYALSNAGSKGTIDEGLRLRKESVDEWLMREPCLLPWAAIGPYWQTQFQNRLDVNFVETIAIEWY